MATFSQHHMDGLELHLTPLQYFARVFVNEKEEKLRSHLANFGIAGELAQQAMYTLSGGQKSRVAFSKVRLARLGHAAWGACSLFHLCASSGFDFASL